MINKHLPAPEERANHMNTVTTTGLAMWRVSLIAWKRRSGKRLNRLISGAHGLSRRLFTLQRRFERC
jgi:hypothetical protein